MSRYAVVLFNLGGPSSPAEVRPFLQSLFSDESVIALPKLFRLPLAWFIAKRRTPKAQKIYAHLGGKSPILEQTQAQAQSLQQVLSQNGDEVRVVIAMRHAQPYATQAVQQVAAFAPQHVVLLPLYPQFSTTTTGSALLQWQRESAAVLKNIPTSAVCCYPLQTGLVATYAAGIRAAHAQYSASHPNVPCRVLLSAHGLPEKVINAGDPYQAQVEQTAAAITALLGDLPNTSFIISYQSRVGPLKWIGPSTDDCIMQAGKDGAGLIVCPLSFVSEHSETLVELDIEYGHLASEHKVPFYARVPTVSTDPHFIASLADQVQELLGKTGVNAPTTGACAKKWGKCPCATGQ